MLLLARQGRIFGSNNNSYYNNVSMKKIQKYVPGQIGTKLQRGATTYGGSLDQFIDSFLNCNILYQMKITPQLSSFSWREQPELPMIKHVFANTSQLQNLPKPSLCLNTTTNKQTNKKSLFDTFNHTDFTHSNEDQEYSNYLQEYQTLKKESIKKESISPEQQSKQMKLLIHQFLSDIPPDSGSIPEDPTKLKSKQKNVKVEKIQIDLNAFQVNKAVAKSPQKPKKGEQVDQPKKQATPRFINLNDFNTKGKRKIESKQKSEKSSAQKRSIQVIKVTNLGAKSKTSKQERPVQKFVIAKNVQKLQQPANYERQLKFQKKECPSAQKDPSFSYSKNMQLRQTRPSNNNEPAKVRKKPETPEIQKKPLKIQIQIPLEEFSPKNLKTPGVKEGHISQLDQQSQQIIKDISHKVFCMLQKSKQISKLSK